jgi:hypothetical protein
VSAESVRVTLSPLQHDLQEGRPVLEARLLTEHMADGGWNREQESGSVRGSFWTTIAVLEGLLELEVAVGGDADVAAARRRGEAYLLDRRHMRRLSTGELVDPSWLAFSYPPRFRYDVLRSLDHLRAAGVTPDARVDEAIALVGSKRGADGRWLLENPRPGAVPFELDEGEGRPSRWNTLLALRVLRWHASGDATDH